MQDRIHLDSRGAGQPPLYATEHLHVTRRIPAGRCGNPPRRRRLACTSVTSLELSPWPPVRRSCASANSPACLNWPSVPRSRALSRSSPIRPPPRRRQPSRPGPPPRRRRRPTPLGSLPSISPRITARSSTSTSGPPGALPANTPFPGMSGMQERFESRGFAVVAVNLDRDPKAAEVPQEERGALPHRL